MISLQEFFEQFLPEYEQKGKRYDLDDPRKHDDYLFFTRYFSEALENHDNLICQNQRKNCTRNFDYNRYNTADAIRESILNAPMPEPIKIE